MTNDKEDRPQDDPVRVLSSGYNEARLAAAAVMVSRGAGMSDVFANEAFFSMGDGYLSVCAGDRHRQDYLRQRALELAQAHQKIARLEAAVDDGAHKLAAARATIWRLEDEVRKSRAQPAQWVRGWDLPGTGGEVTSVEMVRIGNVIVIDDPIPTPQQTAAWWDELLEFSAHVMWEYSARRESVKISGVDIPCDEQAQTAVRDHVAGAWGTAGEGFGALEDPPPATPLPVAAAKPALPIAALGGGDGVWRG